jgi:hypothetical protein
MEPMKSKVALGATLMFVSGVIGSYAAVAIYAFYVVFSLLPFAERNYPGLVIMIVVLILSVFGTYLGHTIIRRSRRQNG